MPGLFETVTDVVEQADTLRRRRYGLIQVSAGQLESIRLRPWPKRGSVLEARLWGRWLHRRLPGDRCWLYYNQPLGSPDYLALRYVVSSRDCTLATFRGALEVLDEIARLKRTAAIFCHASNARISDRLLTRWGWQPFASSTQRQFIKRFERQEPARWEQSRPALALPV